MKVKITGKLCELPLQQAYCEAKKLPMFAPKSGRCFKCRNLVEDTDREHLTGCRHCNYSWCS